MDTINLETGEVISKSIKNVAAKIAAAMLDIETYAPKDGTNTFHKYQFTSIAQYVAHVRPALVKHGLIIIPSLIDMIDHDDATTDVKMQYTIIDRDSGEFITAVFMGRGQDATREGKRLDKGPYKAYSGAFKYFLQETFLIASGDDPDEDVKAIKPEKSTNGKIKQFKTVDDLLYQLCQDTGKTESEVRQVLKAAGYTGFTVQKSDEMYRTVVSQAAEKA